MQDDITKVSSRRKLKDRSKESERYEVLYVGTPQRLTAPGVVYNAEHRRKWRWTGRNRQRIPRTGKVELGRKQRTLVIALCRLRLAGEHAFSLTVVDYLHSPSQRLNCVTLAVFSDLIRLEYLTTHVIHNSAAPHWFVYISPYSLPYNQIVTTCFMLTHIKEQAPSFIYFCIE